MNDIPESSMAVESVNPDTDNNETARDDVHLKHGGNIIMEFSITVDHVATATDADESAHEWQRWK